MTTEFVPEMGTRIVRTEERPVTGLVNAPEHGTPIRATLGETVIVGTVIDDETPYGLIYVQVDAPESTCDHTLRYSLWIDAGWKFEILAAVTA